MKLIKDSAGKDYYIQARHVSCVSESAYMDYFKDDEDKKATEVWIYGGCIYIDAPLRDVIKQLDI
jgi:hypothetical protein